jgi:hypothetical protein
MGGKPCIRGMRVTVSMVIGLIASGYSNKTNNWGQSKIIIIGVRIKLIDYYGRYLLFDYPSLVVLIIGVRVNLFLTDIIVSIVSH